MLVREIHKKTIETYGAVAMINKCIQEFNECIEELRDNKAGAKNLPEIMEELQDCKNMIDKMEVLFGFNPAECREIKLNKMKRTLERIS